MVAFGPVPSRRLGRSLGINNIPPKVCTYACVYCQLGRTPCMRARRQTFFAPGELRDAVQEQVARASERGEAIDYLTFVPEGEPTLDLNLGREIQLLKHLGIPVGVISNASLIWRQDVRADLMLADWVSLKVDAIEERVWRRVNRPLGSLDLDAILDGVLEFADRYQGFLATETMLVAAANDSPEQVRQVACLLARMQPGIAYLAIPTRPPAEKWVRAPDEAALNRAYQILSEKLERVETLIGYEGDAFAVSGDVAVDLLSITAVHPMRADAVQTLLARAGAERTIVDQLVAEGHLREVEYEDHKFYLKRIPPHSRGAA